jgi:hypothetical protein
MPECVLRISKDKAFFQAETPDANWESEQINDDGLNFLCDSAEAPDGPIYLVVTDYQNDDGPKANQIYLLVPIQTTLIEDSDLESTEEAPPV